MKCTIESIRRFERKNECVGSVIKGFLPLNVISIPDKVFCWINNYKGVNAKVTEEGVEITSISETHCLEGDNYEYELGAHIAETKAKVKLFKFVKNLTEKLANYYMSLSNEYQDAYLKYEYCMNRDQDHVVYLGKTPADSEK